MKLLLLSLLTAVVCIGYSCGHNHLKWNAQQALLNAANIFEGPLHGTNQHSINRRQTANENRCTEALLEYQCTSGYGAVLVNISATCGNNKQARGFAAACARNENNQYCPLVAINTPDIPTTCTFFGNCPSSCRNYLQSLRSTLGCCINSLLNFTDSTPEIREIFSYSVWSRCGVETVLGSCNNGLDFTPIFENKVCSDDDLHQAIATAECSPPYSVGIENALRNEGVCGQILRFEQDACTVNSNGNLCAGEARDDLVALSEAGTASIIPLINNCASATTSFCPSSCRSALLNFRSDLGCCADTIYGNPNSPNGVVIPAALWDVCNVDNPGLCKSAGMITTATYSGLSLVIISLIALYM